MHGVGLRGLARNLIKLTRGVIESRKALKDFKPDVIFFTGGYVAAPMALAGRNIPIVLYVPDIEPGLALKFLANFADVITLTAPDSKKYFSCVYLSKSFIDRDRHCSCQVQTANWSSLRYHIGAIKISHQ